jgi:hypothetical protein
MYETIVLYYDLLERRKDMPKLANLMDTINRYLTEQGLAKIMGEPENVESLLESALRSVWQVEDKERRETLSIEIAAGLKNYYGGKRITELLEKLTKKMDEEEKQRKETEEKEKLKQKLKDPNYIPTFDELMNS